MFGERLLGFSIPIVEGWGYQRINLEVLSGLRWRITGQYELVNC